MRCNHSNNSTVQKVSRSFLVYVKEEETSEVSVDTSMWYEVDTLICHG